MEINRLFGSATRRHRKPRRPYFACLDRHSETRINRIQKKNIWGVKIICTNEIEASSIFAHHGTPWSIWLVAETREGGAAGKGGGGEANNSFQGGRAFVQIPAYLFLIDLTDRELGHQRNLRGPLDFAVKVFESSLFSDMFGVGP